MEVTTPYLLGAVLRGRRRDLGLSQAEVASRAGVSRAWLSNVERGKPSAEVGLVLRLLGVLGLALQVSEPVGSPDIDLDEVLREYGRR